MARRPRKTPSKADAQPLRAILLTAAERELTEVGAHKLSLRSIARRAGVSEAAPYHHFQGKDDLLQAVAVIGFERLLARFGESSTSGSKKVGSADERLEEIGVAYASFALESTAMFQLMFGHAATEGVRREDFRRARARVFGVLNESIAAYLQERGASPERLATSATAAWAVVHGLATLLIENELDPVALGYDDPVALVRGVLRTTELIVER